MGEEIKKLYRKKGLTPPKGKGIHTKLFHKCVVSYLTKGMSYREAAKRCMGGIGRNLAVNKSHWRSPVEEAVRRRGK